MEIVKLIKTNHLYLVYCVKLKTIRKPNEILNDSEKINSMHTCEGIKHFALIAIAIAQKETYNEAINNAAENAKADSKWKKGDTEKPTPFVVKKSILKLLK